MGQAFDRDGNVLGAAEGETMQDLLDTLQRHHPEAEEIRLYALRDKVEAVKQETAPMPGLPAPDRMLQFFVFEHLPPHLAEVSKPFAGLAQRIVDGLPSNPERTVALRKLLEAKDCAVRALLFK